MAELHKAKAAAASETQVARLSVEMQTKQELQMVMDRQHLQHKQESEALITQVIYSTWAGHVWRMTSLIDCQQPGLPRHFLTILI